VTAAKVRTAGERLEAARAAIPQVEAKIDTLMTRRREILRHQDANSLAAINADRAIVALQGLRLRLVHQVDLLSAAGPHVVTAQQQGWTWPSSLEDANAALAEIQPTLLRLRSIPPNDRHAGHDRDQDFLVQREYRLLRLIESFQPRVMTAR
jgi:hypothetical protein